MIDIKYFIDDEDLRSEVLENTSNLEVIADEDLPEY